jgi:acetyl-CoA synthetase
VSSAATETFRAARDFLLEHRTDYLRASAEFEWPNLTEFNWALDWFDAVAAEEPTASRLALWIVEEDGSELKWTFAEVSRKSNQVANWLRAHGVRRGDRLILMLGNQGELWLTILAAMKLGAVLIPASTLLGPVDLRDRVDRGRAAHVVVRAEDAPKFADVPGDYTRIAVARRAGWTSPTRSRRRRPSARTPPRRRTTRCCCTSPPARPRGRSWCSTRTRPTRSAICPRCTGSASSRATCT